MKEILIEKQNDIRQILLIEDGELIEKYTEDNSIQKIEGNIYIGKVKNILPGMQAAFIDIGYNKNTFIHLKDILPKVDVKCQEEIDNKLIRSMIKEEEPILVQVKRDFTETKGAKVSTHISINSRFVVLMPNTTIITISQKIENEDQKERLNNIVKKYLPQNCGAIIRTAAENMDEEIIKKDIEAVVEKWNNINKIYEENKKNRTYPRLIYKSHDIIKKLLIDLMDKDLEKITVNTEEDYNYMEKTLKNFEKVNIKLILNKEEKIQNKIDLTKQIQKSNNRKVWLKCGGFITIDKTEALTAIDVNSGKYTGKDNLEHTVYRVNKEASIEIAKQFKLRDIGGIIIIDYIDMKSEEDKQKIIEILQEELKKDRAKTQIVGFSKLNLLELTRKHICGR